MYVIKARNIPWFDQIEDISFRTSYPKPAFIISTDHMTTKDRQSFFEAEFSDVKSLTTPKRVARTRTSQRNSHQQQAIRENAQCREDSQLSKPILPLHLDHVDPHAALEWKYPGVQPETLIKLKKGEYRFQAKLDLHERRLHEAYEMLYRFVNDSISKQFRTVLVVHGLGIRGDPPAQLKSHVNYWLQQLQQVNAFVSAPPHLGGVGAVLVHLKKSKAAKQQTRERIDKRLG